MNDQATRKSGSQFLNVHDSNAKNDVELVVVNTRDESFSPRETRSHRSIHDYCTVSL